MYRLVSIEYMLMTKLQVMHNNLTLTPLSIPSATQRAAAGVTQEEGRMEVAWSVGGARPYPFGSQ